MRSEVIGIQEDAADILESDANTVTNNLLPLTTASLDQAHFLADCLL